MKKLMIAAAIVCAAVASQAAVSLSWKANWITDESKADVSTSAKAYLVDNLLYGGEVGALLTAVAAGQFDTSDAAIMYGDGELKHSSGNGTYISLPLDAIANTWSPEQAVQMYTVIIDGDKIGISQAAAAGTALPADNNLYTAAFGDLSKSDGTTKLNWYTAVPEPTSGLLLLLGVAGLALRRRRA